MFTNMDYVYEVYKESSFSKAAKNLYISQSSLSLSIKRTEEKIGMPIFDRSTYPIQLTEFGELYINAVEDIRNITNSLTDYIYDFNHLQKGNLSIGAGNFFATYLVAPAIFQFKQIYPNIEIQLLEGRTIDLESKLANGTLDMLITNGHLDSELFQKTYLFEETLILAVPKHFFPNIPCPESLIDPNELANGIPTGKPGVSLKEFEHIPFVGLRSKNDSRIRADLIFVAYGIHPSYVVELDQSATAYRLARDGMGACIVGDSIVLTSEKSNDLLLYKIDHPKAYRDVSIFTRNSGYTKRMIKLFSEVLIKREKKL